MPYFCHLVFSFSVFSLLPPVFFSLRSGRPNHRGEVCSAHFTIRSSPLPLLLSTIALQSILPPFNSTCNQLYALQRAVRIERAAPGHPARPPQLQRTSPLERASSRLPAALLCTPPGVYKSSGRTSKAAQYSPATSSSAVPARTVPLHQTSLCSLLSYLARLNTIVYPRSSVYSSILSCRHVRVRASRFQGADPLQYN